MNETFIEHYDPYKRRNEYLPRVDIQKRGLSYFEIYYKFNLKFYNLNLKYLSYIKNVELKNELYNVLIDSYPNEYLFFKSLPNYIKGKPFVIFIYYISENI